ncbi:MAG: ATP-binding cassette domain-containing protein, partial [Anaeroplasmataceae bacterium]|nr:ATP-binding cassette domain-containing protein [Anaeroplasmataceae bacterium]
MEYVTFQDVTKKYIAGSQEILANNNVSFSIKEKEFCVIVGPSGAGKTTILNLLGGMEGCDSGNIFVDGAEVSKMNDRELTNYR